MNKDVKNETKEDILEDLKFYEDMMGVLQSKVLKKYPVFFHIHEKIFNFCKKNKIKLQ